MGRLIKDEKFSQGKEKRISPKEIKNLPQAMLTLPDGTVFKASSMIVCLTNNAWTSMDGPQDEDAMAILLFGPWSPGKLIIAGLNLEEKIEEALEEYGPAAQMIRGMLSKK